MTEHTRLSTDDLARAARAETRPEGVMNRNDAATAVEPAPKTAASREAGQDVKPTRPHAAVPAEANTPLLTGNEAERFHKRWADIQAGFVDEPRRAVQEADGLVAETMKRLAETFANERTTLEHQWDRGDNVTTEDLRVALQRYRSFFSRLLSV